MQTDLLLQWDKSINPTCSVNVYAFFVGNAIPNILTDWALLLLPIPYIWHLHQSKAQKIALCGVFGLGGLYVPRYPVPSKTWSVRAIIERRDERYADLSSESICIISIVRLYIIATQLFHTSSTDVTWVSIGACTWTAVEVNIAIVSGATQVYNLIDIQTA